jgi:hypothetical protein
VHYDLALPASTQNFFRLQKKRGTNQTNTSNSIKIVNRGFVVLLFVCHKVHRGVWEKEDNHSFACNLNCFLMEITKEILND